jgi:putative ubiquitin-RnfH superfamily antitoxin RatB of RatAB toxin-antitoxin module
VDYEKQAFGIFGRRAKLDHPLKDGDRVEVYRPLTIDPKEARRRRASKKNR